MSLEQQKLRDALLHSVSDSTYRDYGVEFPDGTVDWGSGFDNFADTKGRVDFIRDWQDRMRRLHITDPGTPKFVVRDITVHVGEARPMGSNLNIEGERE